MNLRRRTAVQVFIARPAPITGSVGGVNESFAAAHQAIAGHLLPADGALKAHAAGEHSRETLTLLLPPGADILPGDGVGLKRDDFPWRVTACARFPLHICAHLEARTR